MQQAIGLYPASDTTNGWVHSTLVQLLTSLNLEPNSLSKVIILKQLSLTIIVPKVMPALYYAAKSAFRPYQTSVLDSLNVAVETSQIIAKLTLTATLAATANDARYDNNGNSPEGITEGLVVPNSAHITSSHYSINAPS